MDIHPIQQTSRRWMTAVALAVGAAGIQAALLWNYAAADWLSAMADGVCSVGLLCLFAYLSWYVTGYVSMMRTDLVVGVLAMLFWLAGGFAIQYIIEDICGTFYDSFHITLPFRLLYGTLCWVIVIQWYHLQVSYEQREELADAVTDRETLGETQEKLPVTSAGDEPVQEEEAGSIDRITVKDGTRIHLIETEELLYIQACGDYVTLVTTKGQYVKEQTMKYLEVHLPSTAFVRIHRSTIVNVKQISRVELYGKESYQLLLKNGVKLKVSNSGYRLLKVRLNL